MNLNGSVRLVSLLTFLSTALCAQMARQHDPVALKHWAAPLYWQPTQATTEEHGVVSLANAAGLPATANPLVFVAMTPCRVVDTRASSQGFTGAFGPPSLLGVASRTFPILSSPTCSIPAVAQAYSFEITVVPPGPLAYITAYPTGQSSPVAAIAIESPQGSLASNTGIIPAGTNGSIDIYASDPTDIVVDINGYYASISTAPGNFALGPGALANNTSGGNTAIGNLALQENTTGGGNTAIGNLALQENITGGSNTATGDGALQANTTGGGNTGIGTEALGSNTTGTANTSVGETAMQYNTTGNNNTALGVGALLNKKTGDNNIAIGEGAGFYLTNTSNNIDIGSGGSVNDSGATRIGTSGTQTSFFAAGVRGVTTANNDAIPVMVDSNGQLGTVSSSKRFKEDIHDMGMASSDLLRLRPVIFRYQRAFADGSKPIQYGLIAEEVAEVYPDLVAHSADGQIETVKYQVLDSMLLNELQKEHAQLQEQAETIRLLAARLATLEKALLSDK